MLKARFALQIIAVFLALSTLASFSNAVVRAPVFSVNPDPVQSGEQYSITAQCGTSCTGPICPENLMPCLMEVDYAPSGSCSVNPSGTGVECPSQLSAASSQCYVGGAGTTTLTAGNPTTYTFCQYNSGTYINSLSEQVTPSNSFSGSSSPQVTSLCSALSTVQTVLLVIGILLIVLGGTLFAASHVMPGQSKGSLQGYGMGMILGGVIGLVIAVLAPYIFQVIVGNSLVITSACG